jgi:uncharacterized protein (DUF697 family)
VQGSAPGAPRSRVSLSDHALIHGAATAAGLVGAGLARLPGADLPVLTGLQASLVTALALRRGVPLGRAAAVDLVLQLLAGMTGRWIAGQLGALLPPGAGEAVRAATAAALTEAVGWAAVAFFEAEADADARGAHAPARAAHKNTGVSGSGTGSATP